MNPLVSLQEDLKEVENLEPFTLVFYGSRARNEEDAVFSDYNFFVLASASDILRADFKRQVEGLLNSHFPDEVINLVFNDFDSFQLRMNVFDPTASHIMEYGQLVHGSSKFYELQKQWMSLRKEPVKIEPLLDFLEKRISFYNKLPADKNLTENISRIEFIMILRLQIIILTLVHDLTLPEIIFFDMPTRFPRLATTMYRHDLPENILSIIDVYEEVHEAKRVAQIFERGMLEDKNLVIKSIKRVLVNSEAILERLFKVI